MGIDEFILHVRRGLPRWERIGHPIDTAFYLAALVWALLMPLTKTNQLVFLVLAAVSCLIITKDEWQHQKLCSGFENWIHSLLFMLHPMNLFLVWMLWSMGVHEPLLTPVSIMTGGFLIYQIVYWNIFKNDRQRVL